MNTFTSGLVEKLTLGKTGPNRYQSAAPEEGFNRVYGGLIIAHAVMIANQESASEKSIHSLHAYFLSAGNPKQTIAYHTNKIREGRSFAVYQVDALQGSQTIFRAYVSLHITEEGPQHQVAMPSAPAPETLALEEDLIYTQAKEAGMSQEFIETLMDQRRHIEVRIVDPLNGAKQEKGAASMQIWMRTKEPLPDDPRFHQAALAYMSDWLLLDTSLRPHGLAWASNDLQVTSLDHALWLHRDFRADQWLLFSQDSPVAHGALGYNRALVFAQSSEQLVASATQEALVRVLK